MASQSVARSESIAAFIPALELLIAEAMVIGGPSGLCNRTHVFSGFSSAQAFRVTDWRPLSEQVLSPPSSMLGGRN
jgi:hypothetical protein